VLSQLFRLEGREFRDAAGRAVQAAVNGPPAPKGWSVFDQIDQHVKKARRDPDETILVRDRPTLCWVLDVIYEPGFPTQAVSGNPVRYWIDPSTRQVVRTSFVQREPWRRQRLAWTFTATSIKFNERPPDWALAGLGQLAGRERPEWIGRPAPEFTLADLDGRQVSLADLRGKVVLLSFWASWCAPCKEEMPLVEKIGAEWAEQGVEVLGVTNEPAKTAREWLARYGRSLRTVLDEKREVFQHYGAGKIPVSVVIDRGGLVVSYLEGLGGEAHFRRAIERALTWPAPAER
jgi:peroxiredoxin